MCRTVCSCRLTIPREGYKHWGFWRLNTFMFQSQRALPRHTCHFNKGTTAFVLCCLCLHAGCIFGIHSVQTYPLLCSCCCINACICEHPGTYKCVLSSQFKCCQVCVSVSLIMCTCVCMFLCVWGGEHVHNHIHAYTLR